MMPDFSEFSYGFAFTHEYVNRNPAFEVRARTAFADCGSKKGL